MEKDRLLMASLLDIGQELQVVLEAFREPERPRWSVRFRDYPAYRNIDEAYRVDLWRWLDESGQRCGFTFKVDEEPRFASWNTGYLHEIKPETQHFVIATDDDVVEVLSATEPVWAEVEPASEDAPHPGKSRHFYVGEDDEAIKRLVDDIKARNRPQ